MVNYANVMLWGRHVGTIAADEKNGGLSFEYNPDFVRSGYELSPIHVPLAIGRVYRFLHLNFETFKWLPGFIADCLPDAFGEYLLNAWLASQGRPRGSYSIPERLLFQGTRAMGALTFEPSVDWNMNTSVPIDVSSLVDAALKALQTKESLSVKLNDPDAMQSIIRVGTSAGGSRAKAVVAYNPITQELRSGQVDAPEGFEHYLLKMDGVTNGQLGDPAYYGCLEYSYYRMALACGIDMTHCFLLPEGRRKHFMTKRFDRVGGSHRVHMVSLCGMGHLDFNTPGVCGYEVLFGIMRQLHLPYYDARQAFLRMVFNVVGRNQDDHTKNFAFLLNTDNQWRLSPAYDMTYCYNPHGGYTAWHQMSVNGKRDGITRDDLLAVAESMNIKKAAGMIDDITNVFRHIDNYLEVDIPSETVDKIKSNLCLL